MIRKLVLVTLDMSDFGILEPQYEIAYNNEAYMFDGEVLKIDPLVAPTPTALADFLDEKAESENLHDFAGAYTALMKTIVKHSDAKVAAEVLREIAEHGGLHEMRHEKETPK